MANHSSDRLFFVYMQPEKRVEPEESVTGGPLAHMDQLVNADTTPEQVMN